MNYEPFKCPDCSVWWRGETHKCVTNVSAESEAKDFNKGKTKKDWIHCPRCVKPISKFDWHTCVTYGTMREQGYPMYSDKRNKKWNNNDKGFDPPRWHS